MTLEWIALAAVRWVYLLAAAGLFGLSLFPIYAPREIRRIYAEDAYIGATMKALAGAAFVSTLAWAVVTLASLTGDGLISALDVAAWRVFVLETTFGPAWTLGAALALLNVLLVARAGVRKSFGLLAPASALLLVSHVWLGHAAAVEKASAWAVKLGYTLHVLGAGAWFGGLLALTFLLGHFDDLLDTQALLERFSRLGLLAVAALLIGGVVNAAAHLPRVASIVSSAWGRTLLVKMALVVLMLGLAGLNRFVLMPRLRLYPMSSGKALRLSVVAETVLGVAVLTLTAALGILDPAS